MSIRTAAHHCPSELTFVAANEVERTVAYTALSKHQAGRVNTVQLCLQTGETLCDCKGAECGRECWHQTLVMAAWLAHPAVCGARRLGPGQLEAFGKKLASMCKVYRERIGRPLPADAVGLLAARTVWRERLNAASPVGGLVMVVAMPVAAEVRVAA